MAVIECRAGCYPFRSQRKIGQITKGRNSHLPLEKLAGYYQHLADLAKGYEKDAAKLDENLRYVYGWRDEVKALEEIL